MSHLTAAMAAMSLAVGAEGAASERNPRGGTTRARVVGRPLLYGLLAALAVAGLQLALGGLASRWEPGPILRLLLSGELFCLAAVGLLIWFAEAETSRWARLGAAAAAALSSGGLSSGILALDLPLQPGPLMAAALAAVLAPVASTWIGRGHLIDRVRRAAVASAGDQILVVDDKSRVIYANPAAERFLQVEAGASALPPTLTELLQNRDAQHARLKDHSSGSTLEAWTTDTQTRGPLLRARGILLRDVTGRYQDQERLLQLAHYDSLTQLANRRLFLETLNRTIDDAQRDSSMVGLLYIDLDDFKSINDSFGHGAGDALLQNVADRFRQALAPGELASLGLGRKPLLIARLSGDEFAITVPALPNAHLAYDLADRVLEVLAQPVIVDDRTIRTSASIGIAISPDDGRDVDKLIGHADTALYAAKSRGRNRYARYESSIEEASERTRQVEDALRGAIERNELRLFYQPKVDLRTGTVTSFEALMRWSNDELGTVSPGEFIPVAEDRGLINELGSWALEETCRQIREWREADFTVVPIAVNVSSQQFAEGDLQAIVVESLKRNDIDPQLLELELTERLLLAEGDEVELVLRDLRAIGIRIALDDFGTGYSSLSYLSRFALDVLKMDRDLLRDIDSNPSAAGIAQAVVSMAHSLGLTVVAEGVDDEAQLPLLRNMRCDQIQGFLYAPALPSDEAALYLARPGESAPICKPGAKEPPTRAAREVESLDDAPVRRDSAPVPVSAPARQKPAPLEEIGRMDRGRVLIVDDGDAAVGTAALRLSRLGIDVHYAAELDEARLFITEEAASIRAIAIAPTLDLKRLRLLTQQLTERSGERRRVVVLGERPDEDRCSELRAAGVDWVLWAPFNDTELRCLMKSAMVRSRDIADRREPRVPVELVAKVSSGQRREVVVVSSLSPRGAFIEMNDPLQVGSSLRIELQLPHDHFRGFARVVHTEAGDADRPAEPSGMGVVFFGSDRDTERILRKAVKELESRYLP